MKSLKQFIADSYEAQPTTGMGPVTFPDVATSTANVMSPDYKHGSGDIPDQRGFMTVTKLKKHADKARKKKKDEQE